MSDILALPYERVPREEVRIGIDGCGVPTFAVPLKNLALAYAKLAVDFFPGGATVPDAPIVQHMKAALEHPEMIARDERICTDLMRAAPGRVFAKTGSEASYGLSLMGKGMGIAIKIEDGNARAVGPVVIEVLRQYGILQGESLERLRPYGPRIPVVNFRKEAVGEIKAVFRTRNDPR